MSGMGRVHLYLGRTGARHFCRLSERHIRHICDVSWRTSAGHLRLAQTANAPHEDRGLPVVSNSGTIRAFSSSRPQRWGEMAIPLLQTKLYIPPLRPELVPRPRLIERLNQGRHRKLALISAPAGFGKTTLLSEWVQAMDRATPPTSVSWLSLDESDSDLTRFLAYFVAALQTVSAGVGEGALGMLHSPQPPAIESMLTVLLNEIATVSDRFVLVLDDYHLMDAKPVDEALTFLLEHLPPQMHLVIATREDPNLPLARLRARGQLTELRAADLRFTPAEAAEFLNQVMGLDLSAEDIAALETRTEGWIAGLQIGGPLDAGTSRHSQLHPGFHRQPPLCAGLFGRRGSAAPTESVRSFLLQTSILDRLSGPLCDAVTGKRGWQRDAGGPGARQPVRRSAR